MGITMDCENIFNTKKERHGMYHFNLLFRVCHICHFDLLSLIHIEVWNGLEAFSRTSERVGRGGGGGCRKSKVLVIF